MYILIDIGGTKTRVTFTKNGDSFEEPTIFKTPQDFSTWLANIHKSTEFILLNKALRGVIVGVPGTFTEGGTIIKTPNLPAWHGAPIKEHLERLFSVAVILKNDTALVGLGEAVYGAGKGHDIVAYVTISTGVNGVRIIDGAIDRSTYGFEIGHSIIDITNEKDVESLIGGGSLEHQFGKPSHEVHDITLWERVSRHAGVFGANTIMYWSPSIIVYGGPVMNDLHIETIKKEAIKHLQMYKEHPEFVRGILKDFGGLYGALALSKILGTRS
ncbi:MAG: ROK family protein [Candidatus Pacebacteria bacterium]|nr:ROK family protein [Candidatus Paceibacterota bacterium]